MDYDTIKALAKQHNMRVTDLIALAPGNDPFYVGTEASKTWAHWFADLWYRFGYSSGVHLRRIHYQVISQTPAILTPNGDPYENTERCWDALSMASKRARYLHLVDAADFDDKRNPEPVEHQRWTDDDTRINVEVQDWFTAGLPDFPAVPSYALYGFDRRQAYHLEIWCEKSTMNDVLLPLAQDYEATVQIGVGELSVTKTLDLIRRIERDGRPARIFYISDFDPAGKSMPVAVSRKLEFFRDDLGLDIDARLFPLVLTEEQCQEYRLPRTPIKDTERRAARFEERFGEGATELDALEALRPGELRRILEKAIRTYYDMSLPGRIRRERIELYGQLTTMAGNVVQGHQAEIDELREEYEALSAEVTDRLLTWDQRRALLWERITAELEQGRPALDDYPVPEPVEADEDGDLDPLYSSDRDYMEQLSAYKEFQGKAS